MAEERKLILTLDDKGAVKSLKDMVKETDKVSKNTDKADKTNKKFSKGLKGIGVAWKAIGIGAIIGLLVRLANMFGENQKVADLFATAMEGISIVTNDFIQFVTNNFGKITGKIKDFFESPGKYGKAFVSSIKSYVTDTIAKILDGFSLLGSAIKKVFKGDFDGAIEDAKAGGLKLLKANPIVALATTVIEKGKEVVKAVNTYGKSVVDRSVAIVKANKAALLSEVELQALQLESQKLAERQRQIRDDVSKSINERIEANKKLEKILSDQLELEKKAAQTAITSAQLQFDKTKNDKDLLALKTANLKLLEIEERVEAQSSEQKVNKIALEKELLELEKSKITTKNEIAEIEAQSIIDEELIVTRKLELQKMLLDEQYNLQKKALEDEIALHDEGTLAYQTAVNAKNKLDAKYSSDVDKNNREQLEAERALAKQKLQIAQDAFGVLADILGKNSKAGKAAAVAQALINTYQGVTEIWRAPPIGPAPIDVAAKIVGTAAALKSGFSAVKQITATKIPGGGGGGAAAPSAPQAVASAPTFTTIGNNQASQISDTISESLNNQQVTLVTDELEMHQNSKKVTLEQTSI